MTKRRTLLLLATSSLAACSEPSSNVVCIDATDAGVDPKTCVAAYEPTFDLIEANTFRPTCAKSGVSCHASTGRQGGLNFEDPDDAYGVLLEKYVRRSEPACSPLVHRLVSKDGNVRMPPGRSLPEGEQCAIARWIGAGALR
jgi:hypothetical protein